MRFSFDFTIRSRGRIISSSLNARSWKTGRSFLSICCCVEGRRRSFGREIIRIVNRIEPDELNGDKRNQYSCTQNAMIEVNDLLFKRTVRKFFKPFESFQKASWDLFSNEDCSAEDCNFLPRCWRPLFSFLYLEILPICYYNCTNFSNSHLILRYFGTSIF